ncbi:MAG: hypothetical protein IJZ44_06965 [Lachnospiraceae bacterium]|nr:hypothetical protein [Lachnospiraceae bacterium]
MSKYTKMINGFNKIKWYLFTFVVTFLYRMLMTAGEYDMRCASDDMGMLAAPAWLAGYDWSEVIANTKYYGVAYSIFFTPLFKYIENPIVIWQCIVYLNLIIVAIGSVYGQYLGVKYLKLPNNIVTALIAIVSSLCIIPSAVISQESALYFVTWIIAGGFIKCVKEDISIWERIISSIIVVLFSIYGYLIHTRSIVFFVAIFATVIIYTLIYKKKIKNTVCFSLVLLIGYVLADRMKDVIANFFWTGQEVLMNTELPVSTATFTKIFSAEGIRVVFDACVSNLFCASTRTYGISTIVLVFLLIVVWNVFAQKKYQISMERSVMLLFSGICFLMGIVGVAVIWGKGVVGTYFTEEVNVYYKGFSYYRYYASFLGPAIFVTLSEVFERGAWKKKEMIAAWSVNSGIIIYWLAFILDKLKNSEYVNRGFVHYVEYEYTGIDFLNLGISILTSVLVISIVLLGKRFAAWGLVAAVVFAIVPFMSNIWSGTIIPKVEMPDAIDASYYLINDIDESGQVLDNIYCPNVRQSYYCQYVMKDKTIHVGYPSESESALIFTKDSIKPQELSADYKCIVLDAGEYVWVADEKLYEYIKKWVWQDYLQEHLQDKMHISKLASDEQGFAMYGPYIDLDAGAYQVVVHMSDISDIKNSKGYFDVVSEAGENIIYKCEYIGAEKDVSITFELEEMTENIEIRYYKYQGNDIVPVSILIDFAD